MITPHAVIDLPDEMVDEILFEVSDAPHDSVVHFLRRACVLFCEQSFYWQEECEPLTMVDGTQTYTLATGDAKKQVVSVTRVTDDEDNEFSRSQNLSVDRGFWQNTPATIDIYSSSPLADKIITVVAAIRPALSGSEFKISAPLIADYRDALISGAKSMLYITPNRPWTNPQLAQICKSTFDAIADDAHRHQARGYSRINVKPPRKVREFY